jgi:hypothetical protein
MNNIPQRQLERDQLERLAAQRELYSSAKNWYGWQMVITILIPILLAIAALADEQFAIPAAIFGVFSFFIDMYFIDGNIKSRKERAAKIQELFDCDLFGLPISPLKTSDDIKVEEVLRHYDAHSKIPVNIELIKGWYSEEVGKVPLHIARIICQRTNCWWDATLRKRYASFFNMLGVLVLFIVMSIGIIRHMELTSVLLLIGGLTPFFQFCVKQHNDNADSIKRLDELYSFAADIWNKAINECETADVLLLHSRRLQDEIFTHRSNNPLVMNFIYKRFRDNDEVTMNTTAEKLVQEALTSKCIQ